MVQELSLKLNTDEERKFFDELSAVIIEPITQNYAHKLSSDSWESIEAELKSASEKAFQRFDNKRNLSD